MTKCELYNDNFQNYKVYNIPAKAQLVIADIPYNLGKAAYGSNPMWYQGGQSERGERQGREILFQHRWEIQHCRVLPFLLQAPDQRAEGARQSSGDDCLLRVAADPHGTGVRQEARLHECLSALLHQEQFLPSLESQHEDCRGGGECDGALSGQAAEVQQRGAHDFQLVSMEEGRKRHSQYPSHAKTREPFETSHPHFSGGYGRTPSDSRERLWR